ncbi:MAG TPA: C-terminal helicase domain-containing protein, partial [Gemmataceae bacterium]|nr:C-terminal helicase domain-containing protein [Gemmataceae bacterium]
KLLERFRDDASCRVFLSTDAGGVGLNLQSADTVINLEVPWNPAVLEQRIARVHRMGQHRPVQVFNLVTRDSIEERVLRTLEVKRSLFEGVFDGTADAVSFAALGQRAFLDTVRGLLAEEEARRPAPAVQLEPAADPRQALVLAGVQFLEALAAWVGEPGASAPGAGVPAGLVTTDARTGQPVLQVPLPPPEVLQRGAAALRAILGGLGVQPGGEPGERHG